MKTYFARPKGKRGRKCAKIMNRMRKKDKKGLIRGTLVNRTYGGHKNLYIHIFLLTIFGPVYYRPP